MEKLKTILFNKRFFLSLFLSWIIFIAIDFVAHASVLKNLWITEASNVKPKEELFKYIPEGYLSFLLLTLLVVLGYKYIFKEDPGFRKAIYYAVLLGFLFSVSQLLGMHSFLLLSFHFLLLISLVYWVEIIAVVLIFRYVYHSIRKGRSVLMVILLFFFLLIGGIVLQNMQAF